MDLEKYFVKSDLIPAIIQQTGTNEVLMLAYMNKESLELTLKTGYTWYYSRSRQRLWNKGETSGHKQKIVSIKADCDFDTLLIEVEQVGPACHTGNPSCFFNELMGTSKNPFRRLPAKIPPSCVKPPLKAQSLASSAFLARRNFCSESTRNEFLEVPLCN